MPTLYSNMSNSTNLSMSKTEEILEPNSIPLAVRFWPYLIFDILSITCSVYILYHFLSNSTIRESLKNHVTIVAVSVGLIHELVSVPWALYREKFGHYMMSTPTFYRTSFFFNYATCSIQLMLFAWATAERYIIIFHETCLSTSTKRFFFHYLPITAIIIYDTIYYAVITYAPFCQNSFLSVATGGYYIPCVLGGIPALATWELAGQQILPISIIVIFNITIIIHALWQKRRLHQPIRWRKHRKMIIQLSSISLLYVILNFLWIFMIFYTLYRLPQQMTRQYIFYGIYIRTYIIFLFPFICFGTIPELKDILQRQLHICHPRR